MTEYILTPRDSSLDPVSVTIPTEIIVRPSTKEQLLSEFLTSKNCSKTETGRLTYEGRDYGSWDQIIHYFTKHSIKKPPRVKQLLKKIKIPRRLLSAKVINDLNL